MIGTCGFFLNKFETTVQLVRDKGQWRKGGKCFRENHGARPRPAAAVRGAERLVQIDVHGINAEVTRADAAHDCVEIRAVTIDETTSLMHRIRDRLKVAFKQTTCIGVSDHHRRNIRAKPRLKRCEIDATLRRCGDILNLITSKGRRCWIGAVRAFGNKND